MIQYLSGIEGLPRIPPGPIILLAAVAVVVQAPTLELSCRYRGPLPVLVGGRGRNCRELWYRRRAERPAPN